jgi:hypothetical protein
MLNQKPAIELVFYFVFVILGNFYITDWLLRPFTFRVKDADIKAQVTFALGIVLNIVVFLLFNVFPR